jgi:putative transposase
LARVAVLLKELFGQSYTLRGTSYLLHRLGWSPQVPQRRAAERDEEAITTWIEETSPLVGTRLRRMQYRPGLLDAFVAHTGLTVDPAPP